MKNAHREEGIPASHTQIVDILCKLAATHSVGVVLQLVIANGAEHVRRHGNCESSGQCRKFAKWGAVSVL